MNAKLDHPVRSLTLNHVNGRRAASSRYDKLDELPVARMTQPHTRRLVSVASPPSPADGLTESTARRGSTSLDEQRESCVS